MKNNTAKWFLCICMYFACHCLSAESITGIVYDALLNEPIIGASVYLKNTTQGTITDLDGKFELLVSTTTGEIVISYVGYKTQTITYKTGEPIKIMLSEDAQILDQVVVIGYGVQKKSDLTGSVSSIATDDLQKVPTTNVVQALQGRTSGVEIVQNSGSPGSSTSIRIRGMGTVNDSDPLYVVDGIPMEDITFLSSDDIASMEILKDATSAAIYGSRAANGVVLITTKSGVNSKDKININLNAYWGSQSTWKRPDHMSKTDYMYFSDYVQNKQVYTQKNENNSLSINPEYQALLDNGNEWWDLVSQNGFMQKYNLALSGGSDKLNYYFSGNYQNTEGIIKATGYDRLSFNLKLNAKPHKNVSLGANVTYANEDKNSVTEGRWGVVKNAINFNPLTPIYDINGSYTASTPVEYIRRTSYDSYTNSMIGQLTLDWDILKWLRFSTRGSYTNYSSNQDKYYRARTNPKIVGSIYSQVVRQPTVSQNISWDNILTMHKAFGDHDLSVMIGQTMETCLYETVYATGYAYGGYEEYYDALNLANIQQTSTGYTSAWRALSFLGRINYSYKGKYLLQSNFRADASSKFAKQNRWGYFPSVSVGWKITGEDFMEDATKYISLLKIRAGWGQLGNNRIGNYAYQTLVGTSSQYLYGIGTPSISNAMSITQYGNEDIKWERTQSTTVGLDMNFLRNKITSSVEWYLKDTYDMLLEIPIVYSSGYASTPMQNAGSVRNQGAEIQVSYRDQFGDFNFEIGGNITFNKNVVTSLGTSNEPILGGYLETPNELGYVNRTVVGAPIACFYGYKTDGILTAEDFDENGRPLVPVFSSSTSCQEGDMQFKDINEDGIIDENDQTFLGSPHPDFYYGFNINLGYKGFDLQLFFQGVAGNQIYNAMRYFQYSAATWSGGFNIEGMNYSNVANDYFDKVYRPEPDAANPSYRDYWGANTSGTVPAISSDDSRNAMNFQNSDFYIEDGDYLRLKSAQLGYSFSKKICGKLRLKNLRIYISGSNLLTFTKYSGLDPEIGKRVGTESNNLFFGIDEGCYPQARTFMAGFNLDF